MTVYAGDISAISAENDTKVYVGDIVQLKCSSSEKLEELVNWFLCKDGDKVKIFPKSGKEVSHNLTDVNANNSGNYSCVYSQGKYGHEVCLKDEAKEKIITILIHGNECCFFDFPDMISFG